MASQQHRGQSRAAGAQTLPFIPVPSSEATEAASSMTEEEPVMNPGREESKRRDEDRVGSRTPVSPNP